MQHVLTFYLHINSSIDQSLFQSEKESRESQGKNQLESMKTNSITISRKKKPKLRHALNRRKNYLEQLFLGSHSRSLDANPQTTLQNQKVLFLSICLTLSKINIDQIVMNIIGKVENGMMITLW